MGVFTLPEGYSELRRIDFQKDKRMAILLNLAAGVLALILLFAGNLIQPIDTFLQPQSAEELVGFLLRMLGLLVSLVVYLVVHEWIHGIFIKRYSGKKAIYGFTGLYAFAGSEAFFNKRQYIRIALAPVVLCGALFLLLMPLVSGPYFWLVYILQVINLTGAMGDLYMIWVMTRLPADVLTCDAGTTMILYSKQTETEAE